MPPTIRAVAHAAGVSITTVSFVLNDRHPHVDAIPEATRRRVREAARNLGYHRNAAAAALRLGKSHWIGAALHLPAEDSPEEHDARDNIALLSAITAGLEEQGHYAVIHAFSQGADTLEVFAESGIAGIILHSPTPETVAWASALTADDIPAVVLHPRNKNDLFPYSIQMDHAAVGRTAAELINLSDITQCAFIINRGAEPAELDCLEGFRAAASARTVVWESRRGWSDQTNTEHAAEFLRRNSPEAVLAAAGRNAVIACEAARLAGLQVPAQMSVIGLGCWNVTDARGRGISTIGVSPWKAGRQAALAALELAAGSAPWTQPRIIEPEFFPRQTTRPEMARHRPPESPHTAD